MNIFRRFVNGKIEQVEDWKNPDREENPMPCPEITFEGIDQALHDKLLAEANAGGVKFDGDKATVSGMELDWNYDAESQVLTVTCTKKPFFITCERVQSTIEGLVAKAKGETL